MNYLTFGQQENSSYKICILVSDIRRDEIKRAYLDPYGLDPEEVIVISLHQTPGKKKTPAKEMKAYIIEELTEVLTNLQVEYLIIGDGDYFKTFTKVSKVDAVLGYVLPTDFGPWLTAYVPNFRSVFYDPIKVTEKIKAGVTAIKSWMAGTYQAPGVEIIKYAAYPKTVADIAAWLQMLHGYDALTCDIECFSLKHFSAGIGTISFAWNENEGIAFTVDFQNQINSPDSTHAVQVRNLLREFFETYQGKLIYHAISYDVYVLIYQLFMDDILDQEGLLYGLEVMLKNWDDTKLISYLATNSCAGNKLSLKDQAQAFAGNYAQTDIQDITRIPEPQLLQYNLIDALSTWHVYNKNNPKMIADNQQGIYEDLFKPAIVDIIQMQLTGMPVDMARVAEVKVILQRDHDMALIAMQNHPLLQQFVYQMNEEWVIQKNQELKKKRVSMADAKEEFNPNSGPQLIKFLYEFLALPVIAYSDSKLPSTKGTVLKSLRNHTQNADVINFLDKLVDYKAVIKILTSFIPAMENAQKGPDGHHYLFGNFNLGGTVSGRLSSSDPNLQNLPANSLYAKLIKSCFKAAPGWFLCGIDFASLEDRISALTTKDPNKLKVYTDGYDGHAMRAVAYFGEFMPDIDSNSVTSINSIAEKGHKYGGYRQDSKVPTFLLTYGGTYIGIMEQAGFPKEKAQKIEAQYHVLYEVSDQWVAGKLDEATRVGYVTVAFGLRVRTPLLAQVIRGNRATPFEAEAEGRTAGNALGQSWCLLNSRAGSEFMGKVRASEFRLDIKPCAQIHDAQYFLVRDNIDALMYANEHVVKACEWQDHPDIWHETVKLGGEFSLFYPDWSKEVGIPNGATNTAFYAAFEKHLEKLAAKS